MSASGAFVEGRFGSFVESQMRARSDSSLVSGYSIFKQTEAWGAVAFRIGALLTSGSPYPCPGTLIYPGTLSSVKIPFESTWAGAAVQFGSIEYDEMCWRRVTVDVVSTPDPNTGTGTSENHWTYTHPRCNALRSYDITVDQTFDSSDLGSHTSSGSEQHWANHGGYLDGSNVDNPAENSTESGTNSYGESITKECVSSSGSLYVEWTINTGSGVTVYRITWDTPFSFDSFLAEAIVMYGSIALPTYTSSSTSPNRNNALVATADDTYSEDGEPIKDCANETDIPGVGVDSPGFVGRASSGILFTTNGAIVVISGARYRISGDQPAKYTRTCGIDGARDTAESELLYYFADSEIDAVPTGEMFNALTEDYIATQIRIGGVSDYTTPTPDFRPHLSVVNAPM